MILKIKLVPGSRRTGLIDIMADGVFKIGVKAPPVEGRANKELVKWLAGEFSTGRKSVTITFGTASRNKSVRILPPFSLPDWYCE